MSDISTTDIPLFTQVDLADRIDLVGNPPLALPRYDDACRAVRALRTVDEVDEIIARADAIRAYARQARNRQLELDAAEIRIRAERRVGELMQGGGRTIGKARGQLRRGVELTPRGPADPPTLAEAGIDKNLAKRARALAAVPEQKFEELLGEKRCRQDRRVVLDPERREDADSASRSESGRGELIAPAKGMAAENAALRRRVAALLRENRALRNRLRLYEAGDGGRGEATGRPL